MPTNAQPPLGLEQQRADEPAAVEGTVLRVTYSNEENGWSVVKCRSKHGVQFSAVGTLLGVAPSAAAAATTSAGTFTSPWPRSSSRSRTVEHQPNASISSGTSAVAFLLKD